MEDELITEEQWRSLPPSSEPLSRFVAFEGIVRRGLNRAIREENGDNYDAVVRMQYMSVVAAAAEELGIPDVRYSGRSNDLNEDLAEFFLAVSRATTRIRLRLESSTAPYTVRLAAATRDSIEKQIAHLRSLVERSTFPQDQRNAILRRLDELLVDLHEPRFSFARTMTVLGGLSFAIAAGTSFLADAPDALKTIEEINRLIWTDQAAENAEIERLGPPPKPLALPAPPKEARVAPRSRSGGYAVTTRDDQDDEIPF